jgi:Fe2+ or Zn2+ uptake regulation protein
VDHYQQLARVRAEILRYLEDHPHSADTAEGVYRWSIRESRFGLSEVTLQKVLEELVSEGHMRKVQLPGGGVVEQARTADRESIPYRGQGASDVSPCAPVSPKEA